MKPQDIAFIIILLLFLWRRNPKYLLMTALACFVLAIPLFHFLVFFTAERLVMYAAGFLIVAIFLLLYKQK